GHWAYSVADVSYEPPCFMMLSFIFHRTVFSRFAAGTTSTFRFLSYTKAAARFTFNWPLFKTASRAAAPAPAYFWLLRLTMYSIAVAGSIAFWYGRLVVMASKLSATATMRAIMGISSPASPKG